MGKEEIARRGVMIKFSASVLIAIILVTAIDCFGASTFCNAGGTGTMTFPASPSQQWTAASDSSSLIFSYTCSSGSIVSGTFVPGICTGNNISGVGNVTLSYKAAPLPLNSAALNSTNNSLAKITVSSGPVSQFAITEAAGSCISCGTNFGDVTAADSFRDYIAAIACAGITKGCGNGNYCPSENVTRDQMAAFLVRSAAGEPPSDYCTNAAVYGGTGIPFLDVSSSDPDCPYVMELKQLGITTGYENGSYGPSDSVTRDQMAAFLIRSLGYGYNPTCNGGLHGNSVPCSSTTPYFKDVPLSDDFFPYIQKLYELGITQGCGTNADGSINYCPSLPVTRDEMAAFLFRAFLSDYCPTTACTTAALNVTVTDSGTGRPIQSAIVTAGAQTGTTNAAGSATFTGLSSNQNQTTPIKVNVSATGYAAHTTTFLLSCGATAAASVSLGATYSVSGTIASNGTGLQGVIVSVSGASTTTDSGGNYSFGGLTNGNYTITPSSSGYSFSPSNTTISVNNANVTVPNFTGVPNVNGACGTSNGGPYTTAPSTNLCSAGTASAVSGSGPWTWSCVGSGSGPTAGCSGGVQTYSISGTVTFNGMPMSGFPVSYSVPGNTPTVNCVVTTTDSNGNYVFTGVANGSYRVTVTSACYNFSPVVSSVTVNGSNLTGQNFEALSKGGPSTRVVSGIIADLRGAPISGVTITAYDTNCNNGTTTTTDANGTYSFTTLGGSDYQIFPDKAGFGFYPSLNCGASCGIIDAGYNGLDRTVIHFKSVPTTPVSGADFTAYRPGDKVVSVPRTGQAISYASGDDASANKGVAWPGLRFTDNNDGTVTDGLTGLVWMKNAGCFAPSNWYDALTEANQLASGQCGLTDGSTAGQWRMPNANEVESIVDISQSNPSVSSGSPFINVNLANAYWSSSSYMASTPWNFANEGGTATFAMAIRFTDGRWINGPDGSYNNDRTASLNSLWAVKSGPAGAINLQATGEYYVMATGDDSYHTSPFCEGSYVCMAGDPNVCVDQPVSGDSASLVNSRPLTSPRLIDNGDGTLSDTVTGLTWLKQANCIQGSWADTVSAVNNLASGQCGLMDGSTAGQWRMPNRFEMLSLAVRSVTFSIAAFYDGAYTRNLNDITGPVVFTTFEDSQFYWTSSTYASDPTQAWTVYSCDFGAYNMPKSAVGYTMAVR